MGHGGTETIIFLCVSVAPWHWEQTRYRLLVVAVRGTGRPYTWNWLTWI
jgi:hypothetical protein